MNFPKKSIVADPDSALSAKLAGNGKYHKLRVLIIDDNSDAADSLRNILNRLGYDARSAHGGKQGLEVAKEFKPNVLFLDLGMPAPNGFEVAKIIKKDPVLSNIFLVALTGFSDEDNIKKTKEAGFDHSLIKPASVEEIRGIIESSVGGRLNDNVSLATLRNPT